MTEGKVKVIPVTGYVARVKEVFVGGAFHFTRSLEEGASIADRARV